MPQAGARRLPIVAAGLALLVLGPVGCVRARDVLPVYLTWSDADTSTTITVHYHTRGRFEGSHVYYDTQPRGGEPSRYAAHARGFERAIPGVDRSVHVVPLTQLTPGATYWFVAGDPASGFSDERSFRTIPDDDSPLHFVVGGDMSTGWLPRLTSWQAARTDPAFALLGGDLAYCRGRPEGYARWQQWFADWEATMQTPDGRLIPLVAAIGNEDLRAGAGAGAERAPFFTGFFYQHPEDRTWFTRRFGRRLALFVLDSGQLAPPDGAQRDWLEAELRANANLPVRLALYHVALFPARKPLHDDAVEQQRAAWLPLFDAFRLTAAFEHHGHLQKRTHPLRGGEAVSTGEGTVYFGDGCWGKSNTPSAAPGRAFLASASARRHFWSVTLSREGASYEAVDGFGRVFDRATQAAGGAWQSE